MARMFRLPHSLQSKIGPLLRRRTPQPARCVTALSNQPALEAAVADLNRQLRAGGQRGQADLAPELEDSLGQLDLLLQEIRLESGDS